MSLRTPLAHVRGLGSAKAGTHHWWMQRLTAVALVPLSLWFVAFIVALATAGHGTVVEWIRSPVVTVLLLLFIVAVFHHAQLGLQVIIEDYVHGEWFKVTSLIIMKFAAVALAFASIVAVLRVAFGG